jgi:hypothetical protein
MSWPKASYPSRGPHVHGSLRMPGVLGDMTEQPCGGTLEDGGGLAVVYDIPV